MKVALLKHDESGNSVRQAIEMCGGLDGLKPDARVLIKPNLCTAGAHKKAFPPFGRNTTGAVVEELVVLLRRLGCRDITIGEGTVVNEEIGAVFKKALKYSGVDRIARDHGVRVVDFDEGPFESVELDGHRIDIAREALETDFLINVPVLKAHVQAVASLGMKNMKGALKPSSKKRFHKTDLDKMIAALNVRVPSNLTLIDGIYSLEHGGPFGPAHRRDLLIASTDVLAADLVGAMVMCKKPSEVGHLVEYARMTGRSLDIDSIEVLGEEIESVAMETSHEMSDEFMLEYFGVRMTWAEPPAKICSGCAMVPSVHFLYGKDNKGIKRPDVEVCIGEGATPHPESKTVFLVGDCAVNSNSDMDGAVKVKGCPPNLFDYMKILYKNTLEPGKANALMLKRATMTMLDKAGIYHEYIDHWDKPRSPEFDMSHFV